MASKSRLSYGSEASPGKIFVGGLAKDTSTAVFKTYFAKYGTVTDDIIIKDKNTGLPRGFGFITFADPSVVDTVIEQTHIINNKQVEIKRTIPKGSLPANTKDFKTKKIFVGGLPATLSEDAFKDFFSKYGTVVEHQIIRDHTTNRSRGFGFIIFDNEQVVDDILVKGNMIDMTGTQVEIKKAEPKIPSNQPSAPAVASDPRAHSFGDGLGALDSYSAFGGSAFAPGPFRAPGAIGSRFGNYGYGGSSTDFGVGYGGIGGSGLGGFRGDPTLGFSSRYGSYGAGLGGGYGAGGLGGYGRGDEAYPGLSQGYGGSGYDSGLNSSYGGAGGLFGSRTGYSGSSRYHPYSR